MYFNIWCWHLLLQKGFLCLCRIFLLACPYVHMYEIIRWNVPRIFWNELAISPLRVFWRADCSIVISIIFLTSHCIYFSLLEFLTRLHGIIFRYFSEREHRGRYHMFCFQEETLPVWGEALTNPPPFWLKCSSYLVFNLFSVCSWRWVPGGFRCSILCSIVWRLARQLWHYLFTNRYRLGNPF